MHYREHVYLSTINFLFNLSCNTNKIKDLSRKKFIPKSIIGKSQSKSFTDKDKVYASVQWKPFQLFHEGKDVCSWAFHFIISLAVLIKLHKKLLQEMEKWNIHLNVSFDVKGNMLFWFVWIPAW